MEDNDYFTVESFEDFTVDKWHNLFDNHLISIKDIHNNIYKYYKTLCGRICCFVSFAAVPHHFTELIEVYEAVSILVYMFNVLD